MSTFFQNRTIVRFWKNYEIPPSLLLRYDCILLKLSTALYALIALQPPSPTILFYFVRLARWTTPAIFLHHIVCFMKISL